MQPPPPSLLSNFFSSLKQVEKRLKLDHRSPDDAHHPLPPRREAPPLPGESNSLSAEESISTPLYLHSDEIKDSSTLQESSEPPQVFLSCSPQFPRVLQIQNRPQAQSESNHPKLIKHAHDHPVDEIQQLIELLGLQDAYHERTEVRKEMISGSDGCEGNSCHCESGFYTKIAGLKGPKCGKEIERLDGWIEYFCNGGGEGERLEPLRLAYLLLGKAVSASEGNGGCFEGLEFPSTVEQFLLNDPPPN